jgi:hypothetical protein
MGIQVQHGPSMFDYGEVVANAAARIAARERSERDRAHALQRFQSMSASMGPQVMSGGGGGGGGDSQANQHAHEQQMLTSQQGHERRMTEDQRRYDRVMANQQGDAMTGAGVNAMVQGPAGPIPGLAQVSPGGGGGPNPFFALGSGVGQAVQAAGSYLAGLGRVAGAGAGAAAGGGGGGGS